MTFMPIIEDYCGIGIHDFQDPQRIAEIVKPEIGRVLAMTEIDSLFSYASDKAAPPEARLFAADKCRAANEISTASHRGRVVDLIKLDAMVAGLDSLEWADSSHVGTLLETYVDPTPRSPGERARLLAAQEARCASDDKREGSACVDPDRHRDKGDGNEQPAVDPNQ